MITRVPQSQYLNMFELAWLVLAAEFIYSMDYLKLYSIETDEWNLRRLFWYGVVAMLLLPVLAAVGFGIAASVKYLL